MVTKLLSTRIILNWCLFLVVKLGNYTYCHLTPMSTSYCLGVAINEWRENPVNLYEPCFSSPYLNKTIIIGLRINFMKTPSYLLVAGFIVIAGNSALTYAVENQHAKEAEQHLEKAVESGKAGDTKGEAAHAQEAEKDLIQENKEKPYPQPSKQITGENPKAEHDKAAFEDIEKAKAHAKKGHANQAADAAKKAEAHIKDKELSK